MAFGGSFLPPSTPKVFPSALHHSHRLCSDNHFHIVREGRLACTPAHIPRTAQPAGFVPTVFFASISDAALLICLVWDKGGRIEGKGTMTTQSGQGQSLFVYRTLLKRSKSIGGMSHTAGSLAWTSSKGCSAHDSLFLLSRRLPVFFFFGGRSAIGIVGEVIVLEGRARVGNTMHAWGGRVELSARGRLR